MLFSSMIFLWVFLPFVIIGNALFTWLPMPSEQRRMRCKNLFLLVCSLFFYAWGGISYILIMLGVILLNFLGAFLLSRKRGKSRKALLVLTVILNLFILFFFKYFNMLVAMVETVMAFRGNLLQRRFLSELFSLQGTGALQIAQVVLPIGISFFTFQAMSYVVDVYRDTVPPQTNILDFALYISLFPQLIAGPIVQYSDIASALRRRTQTREDFLYGIKRFCFGMGKKVLIANTLGNVADQIWALETGQLGAALAWLGMISYTFQIYYDFSGYSDMAIGLGSMLGFHWKENFDYPYTSCPSRSSGADGISLFPPGLKITYISPWGQPKRAGPHMPEPGGGVSAHGHLAWGQFYLPGMGIDVRAAAGGGTAVFRPPPAKEPHKAFKLGLHHVLCHDGVGILPLGESGGGQTLPGPALFLRKFPVQHPLLSVHAGAAGTGFRVPGRRISAEGR